jgi:hypothetical protein
MQRVVHLLGADEVDVAVDPPGGEDAPSPAMTSVPGLVQW